METTPTPFDLNHEIAQWRAGLGESPAFRRENVDELEAHLRDSIASLRQRGLAEDEAFLIATRRAGSGAALGAEFGKINSHQVWLDRVTWMLVGTLAFGLMQSLVHPITELAVLLIFKPAWSSASAPLWAGLCAACLYLLALSEAMWLAWKLLTQRSKTLTAWLRRALTGSSRSVWIAGLVCILVQLLEYFPRSLINVMINRYMSNQAMNVHGGPRSLPGMQLAMGISLGNTVAFYLASSALMFLVLLLARRQLLAKTWA